MGSTYTANDIFSTRGRVEVLRVLWGVQVPMTTAEVARRTHLTHPAAASILREFAQMLIVQTAPAGQGHTYWLNRESIYVRRLVDPVFAAELEIPDAMEQALADAFGSDAISIVLFGSYARGDQTRESDVDVVVVARDEEARQKLELARAEIGLRFRQEFAATLSEIVYGPQQAASLPDRAPDLYQSLLMEGIRISGLGVTEWKGIATE